ncbi:MazG-like family protein [Streptomyces tirandamycinicus]|uniref:MazG-like family protein n=1 Tax=Streptomyces tirandamycinicus TaxID=2174846 RepID=UPI00343AEC7B
MDASTWETVERLRDWLDAESPVSPDEARLLRVLKIGEEFGEVAEALHGARAANPRKGADHTWQDVQKELCDVAVTTLVALATLTPDAQKVFEERLRQIADRSL